MITFLKNIINKNVSEYTELRYQVIKLTELGMMKNELDRMQISEETGGNIRIFNGHGWGFSSFNKQDEINTSLEKTLKSIEYIKGVPRKIKFCSPIIDKKSTVWEMLPETVPVDEKIELIRKYNDILLSIDKIESTRILYRDVHINNYYVNSEGSEIETETVFTGISYSAIARDGSIIQVASDSNSGYKGYENVLGLEIAIEKTGAIASDLLRAEQIPGGKYNVILDPRIAGVFTHEAFGHLSESDFLFENPDMQKKMKIGSQFGPKALNIIDYAGIDSAAGFYFYDDEGIKPTKTHLIKNGLLHSHLHSRETAETMGEELTGNARAINYKFSPIVRMSNTYIDTGTFSKSKIIESIDDGIYACGYIGGMTNLEMFTFSSNYGYKIKNGRLDKLLKDIVLTGNVFHTLNNVTMIGNDLKFFGGLGGCGKSDQFPLPVSLGSPHIRIDDVLIGGQ